jgi:hypothetical protein
MLVRVLFLSAGLVLALACLTYWRAQRTKAAATRFVSDVSALKVGKSGAPELGRIRQKYRRYAEDVTPGCARDQCIAKFQFDDGWSAVAHFFHPSFLYSALALTDGVLTSTVIGTVCYGSNGGEFDAHLRESVPDTTLDIPFREHHTMSSGKVANINFDLRPSASAEQRARAYAFDEGFLGRFGACKDATEMH